MRLKLNNRIADCEVSRGASYDICDLFVETGTWADTGEELTEAECEAIKEANEWDIIEYGVSDLGCYS